MRWDNKRRVYITDRNKVIPPAEVRSRIDEYISQEQVEVRRQAARLLARGMSVEEFFLFMRRRIEAWHGFASVIAYGGEDQMSRERWGRVQQRIAAELVYLADFEQATVESFLTARTIAARAASSLQVLPDTQAQIRQQVERALLTAAPSEALGLTAKALQDAVETLTPDIARAAATQAVKGADLLIGGTVEARAAMYPEATYASYENSVLAREQDEGVTLGRRVLEEGDNCEDCIEYAEMGFVPLDELPEIGDSVCRSRCRCEFEFQTDQIQFKVSELFQGRIEGSDELLT